MARNEAHITIPNFPSAHHDLHVNTSPYNLSIRPASDAYDKNMKGCFFDSLLADEIFKNTGFYIIGYSTVYGPACQVV
jgi:hypothetical protein